MDAEGKSVFRRFRVIWGEMDTTLADPEQIIVDVHTEGEDSIVIVEFCPEVRAGERLVRPAWARKLIVRGEDIEVRNFENLSIAEVYVKSALRKVTMIRYRLVDDDGLVWTINRFTGANEGLSLAEVEIPAGSEFRVFPRWVDRAGEVTKDPNFSMFMLAAKPWNQREGT